jgi:thiamine monophosphate kinase
LIVNAELSFIAALRQFATHPAARGLSDDAAVLEIAGAKLILTHDTLVEGVHYLHTDPPESVAWKLLAVNLSDLAAKGGTPRLTRCAATPIGMRALPLASAQRSRILMWRCSAAIQ